MALTWPIIGIVLFAAMLHASWNALIKSSADKAVDTALLCLGGAAVALPFACWIGPPGPGAAPYLFMSLATHIGYYMALVGAYRHGDLGLTYPIMRGLAPLLVARTIDSIRQLKEGYGLSVLMAEQNFTQAIRIADRGYVIVHGHIEFEGDAAEMNNNDLIRELYLGT